MKFIIFTATQKISLMKGLMGAGPLCLQIQRVDMRIIILRLLNIYYIYKCMYESWTVIFQHDECNQGKLDPVFALT